VRTSDTIEDLGIAELDEDQCGLNKQKIENIIFMTDDFASGMESMVMTQCAPS
jgi:hypothetical protein